jgi:3-dehydroquinate synthetase
MQTEIKTVNFVEIKQHIRGLAKKQLLIIVDVNVWELYHERLDLKPLEHNQNVLIWKAPAGEKTKSFSELERCLEFFLDKGVHRNSHLLALGGGALSDFSGLVASLLLRGITWSVIPTTLLSMVDAGIGGKVAVNSRHGKNLIGAFYAPLLIFFNSEFTRTLEFSEYQSGLGEIAKYALLSSKIRGLVNEGVDLTELIEGCAQYKQEVVEEDYKETSSRIQLNLGHTLGHAFEVIYELPHGVAVIWGMAALFVILNEDQDLEELKSLNAHLKIDLDKAPWFGKTLPLAKIQSYLEKDKKNLGGGKIKVVLCDKTKRFKTREIKITKLIDLMEGHKHELRKLSLGN